MTQYHGERKQRHAGQKNAKFHLRAHFLTSCSSKMPSLFLVCFGTTVFVCLLFSTQFDFEAKATGKYKQKKTKKKQRKTCYVGFITD